MLILLPPSEGKTPPASGSSLTWDALSHPSLYDSRVEVAARLAKVSAQKNALDVLGLGASLADEVAWNTVIDTAPTAAAAQVYTGVLYDAAGAADWAGETLDRASKRVRTISALWGAISPADHIPAYRLSIGVTLPSLGKMAAFWRPHLSEPLSQLAENRLVVDCRSASYVDAFRPHGTDWVTVKVLSEADGVRKVVTHWAKQARGVLAGELARAATVPESAADLADAARELVGVDIVDVDLEARPRRGPRVLSLVTRA